MNYYIELGIDHNLELNKIKEFIVKEKGIYLKKVRELEFRERQLAETRLKILLEAEKIFRNDRIRKKYDQALLEKYGKLKFNSEEESYIKEALLLFEKGNVEKALKLATEGKELHPSGRTWSTLALIQSFCGMEEMAINSYIEALEKSPEDLVILIDLGYLYLNLNRIKDAKYIEERVREIDSDHLISINYIGYTLEKEGKYDEAARILKKPLREDPLMEDIKFRLAELYLNKAYSYCYYNNLDKNYYLLDEESIEQFIESINESNSYIYREKSIERINWAERHRLKSFDPKNKKLFIIPFLLLFLKMNYLGGILAGVSAYIIYESSNKTLWEINRERFLGENFTVKKAEHLIQNIILKSKEKLSCVKKLFKKIIDLFKKKFVEKE